MFSRNTALQRRSTALQRRSTARQRRSTALQRRSTALQRRSTALQRRSTALQRRSTALQRRSTALQRRSTALQRHSTALQRHSTALQRRSTAPAAARLDLRPLRPEVSVFDRGFPKRNTREGVRTPACHAGGRGFEPRRSRQSKALTSRRFGSFRVLSGFAQKVVTRKQTRKVAILGCENLRRNRRESARCFTFRSECSTEKKCRPVGGNRAAIGGGTAAGVTLGLSGEHSSDRRERRTRNAAERGRAGGGRRFLQGSGCEGTRGVDRASPLLSVEEAKMRQ